MSLFWERAVSKSPAAQNGGHSESGGTIDIQQISPGGNWDCINHDHASQQDYKSQHNTNISSNAAYPNGADVVVVHQQRAEVLNSNSVQSPAFYSNVLQHEGIGQVAPHQGQHTLNPKREYEQENKDRPSGDHIALSVQSSTALPVCDSVGVDSAQIHPNLRSNSNCGDNSWRPDYTIGSVASEVRVRNAINETHSGPSSSFQNFSETLYSRRENCSAQSLNNESLPRYDKVQIDPLAVSSQSATVVVGVQRHEEAYRAQEHLPAVAQVAPLRPELDSVPSVQSSTVTTSNQTLVAVEAREISSGAADTKHQSLRPVNELAAASLMLVEADLSHSTSLPQKAGDALNEETPTPQVNSNLQAFDSTVSPFTVKAASTPIDTGNTTVRKLNTATERWEPEENRCRNDFHSSTNHSTDLPVANNSNCTTELSSARNGSERRSVQSRYRMFKEHFSGIMGRLDQYRTEPPRSDFRSSSRTGNPLMANVASSNGRRSIVTVAKSTSHGRSIDRNPFFGKTDEGNTSMFSQGGMSMDRSFELDPPAVYGDDFVDAARRTRRTRLSRPNSRAKFEFGESGLHRGQIDPGSFTNLPPPAYTGSYPSGRRSAHTLLGTTSTKDYSAQQAHIYKEQRRPQSSFDPRSMERFQKYGGRYGNYDAYDEAHSSVSDEANSDDVERDTEEEIRKYTEKDRYGDSREIFEKETVGEEMYYFGAIHLDQFRVRSILHHFPPPVEYYRLPPIEKAAYLFFVAVYKKRYNDIGDFHRKFNREYYKYICEGDSDNIALWKICKSMQDEYYSKKLEESQKAYEASQRQLFSDDRDSVDGMSERASMDDNHDDRTSDILSVDSSQRAPLKHRVPHAFVTFGPGGKMLTVHPDISVSVVLIDDIKSVITDPHSVRLIESAQSFKGPLLIGQTPTHSVRLYIERQIKQIRFDDRSSENPNSNDVIDCLLIWQLLGVIVQQQGRVTGPDVARLLVEVNSTSFKSCLSTHQYHSHREKCITPVDAGIPIGPVRNAAIMDARAYERFTELLLGGHIMEAIDSALRDGLYADAIVLARRLLPHDVTKLLEIEERFIATRPQCNPVVTLVSVSSKKLVPVLINPTGDDSGSWRTHAAIILANLSSPEAMETVYDLGKALAKRDCNCAADFCFLAVAVLAGINPFKPVSVTSAECDSRQHITLIHAGIPNHETLQCRYGFSITDLHATEIFDYAIRLLNVNSHSPLEECIEYHRRRLQYARLIADFGGFTTDAFRYCMEVARAIWNNHHLLSDDELSDLCDLADQLRYGAAASGYETSWIASLRTMMQHRQNLHHDEEPHKSCQPSVQHPSTQISLTASNDQYVSVNPDSTEDNLGDSQHELSSTRRSRTESLADEARDWHAQRQDPLEMSPLAPHPSCTNADITETEENTSRSRTQSTTSQHGYTSSDREQSADLLTSSTISQNLKTYGQTSMDEPLTSDDTSAQSTKESTPIRTLNQPFENSQWVQQSNQESRYAQFSAPVHSSQAAHSHQSQIHSGQNCLSATQAGGLDSTIKKNFSSNGAKGFFGNMKEKLMKAIPSGNEMILPDDSKPTIIWDPVKGRYVGAGVEEDATSAPPPKIDAFPQSIPSSGGLRAARTSGGSRYFNPLNHLSLTNGPTSQPVAPIPVMQVPTTFGFIPSMPADDSGESVDPFSGPANPTVHGVELTPAAQ